eukprot:TRINITY_DN20974_c0_g1_i1.p1 TRINITY_DN20974_c0_g1~~TRINITY_DN20974_c0_g1_i1.p1  ORF type:complete len:520 (-),score=98.72 TRINITY_DN20974_c0_g1_i1:149-1672(-)
MAEAKDGIPLPGNPSFRFKLLPTEDVARAAVLETASYPADEAATPEKLEYRQRVAPELFYGLYDTALGSGSASLVGFVVSTAAIGENLEEETMSNHAPGGDSICIHSVVIADTHRRRGLARAMVLAYIDAIATDVDRCASARRLLLLAHAPLLGLYKQCGFEFFGPSKVTHGSELWFDMGLDLDVRRHLDFVQVDAFTPAVFAGNPAAVLFTQRGGDEAWMQAVAVENNLSETAFVESRGDASVWDIRWFTPGGEVALCGHATLGAAHALWDTGRVSRSVPIVFHTRTAGTLRCSTSGEWIKMDFPAQKPTEIPKDVASTEAIAAREALISAFGLQMSEVLYFGQGPPTTPDWLLEVPPSTFAKLKPDIGSIARVRPMERGVIVTCAGGLSADVCTPEAKRPRVLGCSRSKADAIDTVMENFDFSSRFFAPLLGIDEDPVTGSAHCILAPYWSAKLQKKDGESMLALQASSRGGIIRVTLRSAGGPGEARVDLEGQAKTVIKGRMAA